MKGSTALERAFGKVPADVREAYIADCRARGETPTPVGVINYANADKPLPPERVASIQRTLNAEARRLLVERLERDAASPAHRRRRARDERLRNRVLDERAPSVE